MSSQLPETDPNAESADDAADGAADETPTTDADVERSGVDAETETDYGACPVVESLERIGSKWRLIVLHELLDGERRFNELKRATGANARTLSRVLDDLSETGFVNRRLEEDAPVATFYSLTPKGESLENVFAEIECWAGEWLDEETYANPADERR